MLGKINQIILDIGINLSYIYIILKQIEIMATLTHKESTVTYGSIKAELIASYYNGKSDRITSTITVEGYGVSWSLSHNHGEIPLWDAYAGGFTQDWKIAVSLINTDFMLKLRKEIDKLVK